MRLPNILTTVVVVALLLVSSSAPTPAQPPLSNSVRQYFITRTVIATVNRITVRQPTSGKKSIRFEGAWVNSAVAATVTITKGGTVTGGSAGTINTLDDRAGTAVSGAVYDGTVSTDTVVTPAVPVTGGVGKTIAPNGLVVSDPGGAGRAMFTVELTPVSSASVTILLLFSEL